MMVIVQGPYQGHGFPGRGLQKKKKRARSLRVIGERRALKEAQGDREDWKPPCVWRGSWCQLAEFGGGFAEAVGSHRTPLSAAEGVCRLFRRVRASFVLALVGAEDLRSDVAAAPSSGRDQTIVCKLGRSSWRLKWPRLCSGVVHGRIRRPCR